MGLIRFLVEPANVLDDWPEVHRAYMTGMDGRVFPSRIELADNIVGCRRNTHESAKFNICWPVENCGRPVLSTCSLRERDQPYILSVELARGKISQIKEQLATWELSGMYIPDEFKQEMKSAFGLFRKACNHQIKFEEASLAGNQCLSHALLASEILTQSYTQQRLNVRRQKNSGPPAILGCGLELARPDASWEETFLQTFHSAAVSLEWKNIEPVEGEYQWELYDSQIDWCLSQKLHIKGGPLLDFSPQGLPAWSLNWQNDPMNLQSFVCDFVESTISRYVGKIRTWEIASRANTGGGLILNEEQRLTLVARILSAARQVDQENQLFLRVDQPWGEYQMKGQHRLAPYQFVDALSRSGIGLSGVSLEIAIGYQPGGSSPRDILDLSRLIDLWSTLMIPLHVTMVVPSSSRHDPLASKNIHVEPGGWKTPWSDGSQTEMVDLYVPLLMAKQQVTGIYWSHYLDSVEHHFPHAGLVRFDHSIKPALNHIAAIRKQNERTG